MKYKHGLHYDYPEDVHGHMIAPKQSRKDNLNKDYPYYGHTFWHKFVNVLIEIFFIVIAVPVMKIMYGYKIIGKKQLKKNHKDALKNGFITVCNHIFDADYVVIRCAMKPKMGHVLLWKNNHLRRMGVWIRASGSIPVPKNDLGATLSMMRGVDQALKDKHWVHIYPEASMFYWYQDIRPFTDGAAMFACRNNKPIIPMSFSYRPPRGLYKLWRRKGAPCVNISFGEPLYPNKDLPLKEAIVELNNRAHDAVKKLMVDNTPDVPDEGTK